MIRYSICFVVLLASSILAQGHELPDGQIERRVQVSVKPDGVLVDYSIAMNATTLGKELRQRGQTPAKTMPAMWKQYQKVVLPALAKGLSIRIEGKSVPVKGLRSDMTGWSHGHLTCLLKADIALTTEQQSVVVDDGNFRQTPGDYRIAMKSRSGAKMESSTVKTLVSKTKSVDLTKLPEKQRKGATRAEAKFFIVDSAK